MQQERGQLTRSPLEASAAPFLLLMAENGGWNTIYGGYEKITLIDTQSYDIKKTKDGLKRPAELLNKKLAVEPSDCNIIRKLLSGKWDCNFVHLEKGERVTERHFI